MSTPRKRTLAFRLSMRRRAAADVDDEFAFHLEMRTSELIARGWDADAARAEAIRQFGDVEDAREFCKITDQRMERRMLRGELLTELQQDISYGLRTLLKAPAFTIVAILTLALGIGANTAIFSVVRGVILKPLPFREPDRLVAVPAVYNTQTWSFLSPANAFDWRAQNKSFSSFSFYNTQSGVLTGAGNPERFQGFTVTPEFFNTLGVRPLRGRLVFSEEESAFNGTNAVVIAESLWRSRFGADTNTVGSTITLNDARYRVIGIVPDANAWPAEGVIWYPLRFDPATIASSRGGVFLRAIARLKPGVSVASAAVDMKSVARRLAQQYPDENSDLSADVIPLQKYIVGDLQRPLMLLLGGVGFVLLIACANVANLLLVRGVAREGELAVRTALGASRGRLIRQFAAESALLTFLGCAAGLALAVIGTKLLIKSAPASIPRLDAVHLDGSVLLFTIVVAVVIGVVFGMIPLRQLAKPDIARTLREGG